ncbi:arylalkylamine N-acetyltransferase-like 2 [Drosophila mojavensis]|uniref:aralkylamine N-acetyltransferase n=1 Tax=Drosophila mojavensis TaxID=7230 RepID=B4KFZ9_DROMO|nr:arylalkylamine N-acetyltransferase-like 2 [Drosophila mojavensis]EDW12125.2 uncharacterized protein Dmoj_GI17520 [Drosophila mojavensis]
MKIMVIVRLMQEIDIGEATRFLRDHFYGQEPLMQTPGAQPVAHDHPKRREYRLSLIRQGTSLVALDGERIVGVAFADILRPSDLEQNWLEVNEQKPQQLIEHVHYFLSDVERRVRIFEHYNVTNTLYLSILAVDAAVRRQGLGRRLVSALMDLGRVKGLPLLFTTCTSLYSTRVMAALGMDSVLSVPYADYKDDQGIAVIQPPAPHTAVTVMAIKL